MKNQYLLATALFLTPLVSQAGIIYEWQGVKKKSPSMFSMTLEFDEATVRSGRFSHNVEPEDVSLYPDSGLIAFQAMHTSYRPRTESFNNGWGFGHFHMDLSFTGKFVSGTISIFDFQTDLNMSTDYSDTGSGRLFTIYGTNADYGMGDCAGPTGVICDGGTGYMREVPEPASIALFGLGALAAYGARRRRIVQNPRS